MHPCGAARRGFESDRQEQAREAAFEIEREVNMNRKRKRTALEGRLYTALKETRFALNRARDSLTAKATSFDVILLWEMDRRMSRAIESAERYGDQWRDSRTDLPEIWQSVNVCYRSDNSIDFGTAFMNNTGEWLLESNTNKHGPAIEVISWAPFPSLPSFVKEMNEKLKEMNS